MNYQWDFHRHIKHDETKYELVDQTDSEFRKKQTLYCSADPEDWETLIWYKNFDRKVALGIHPWKLTSEKLLGQLRLLERAISQNPEMHIGETGLDKFKGPDVELQKRSLVRHLYMGYEYDRVVIIHAVRLWKDLLEILKKLQKDDDLPICMIHRFSGSQDIANELQNLGVILSFGPEILDPKKSKLRQTFLNYPYAVLESDGTGDENGEQLIDKVLEELPKLLSDHHNIDDVLKKKQEYAQEFWDSL
jgi:TatD DNase family protein